MELGMGIHGESGAQKLKLLPSRQAADLAFGQLFRGTRALDVKRDDNVLLFVNNLGQFMSLSIMQRFAALICFLRWLFESGIGHHRERCDRKSRTSGNACQTNYLWRTDDIVQYERLLVDYSQTDYGDERNHFEPSRCTDGGLRMAKSHKYGTTTHEHPGGI
jgi:hypothetical protein